MVRNVAMSVINRPYELLSFNDGGLLDPEGAQDG
jgi:hypothetical protein